MNLKKALVLKTKTIASSARDSIFDKDGNKFDDCLQQSKALVDDWEGEANLGLLSRLLKF